MQDSKLTFAEKMLLIQHIKEWQAIRWKRLKSFHNMQHVSMETRHLFMAKDIELIREQRDRLRTLEYELNN